jgi:hypothetical protein
MLNTAAHRLLVLHGAEEAAATSAVPGFTQRKQWGGNATKKEETTLHVLTLCSQKCLLQRQITDMSTTNAILFVTRQRK